MILLALGVAVTSLLHLAAAVPSLKARLTARVGGKAYGPVAAQALSGFGFQVAGSYG